MDYRKEIDGLRSIAVLPVMLFHAGVPWLPGGFVGVDIFFVISGYLITSMIYLDMVDGKFSLFSFYERRMRRILPALFLVIGVTLVFSWIWMVPSRLVDFGKSVLAVCAFISNLYFWKATDYFAPDADMQPLLHTWSLAVEEQFYILFPALFLVLFKFARRWLVPVLVVLALFSFWLAQWGHFSQPETRFFLAHTRVWELALGSLLALGVVQLPALNRLAVEGLAATGLLLIAVAVLFLDREIQYPGIATLLPTLGTALIIVFGRADTGVGRMLSSPLLVGLGLLSYSAYLWHQPLLALARLRAQESPPLTIMVGLCVLAIALAYLSWRFVERPCRNRARLGKPVFFTAMMASLLAIAGTAYAIVHKQGFEQSFLARLDDKAHADYALVLEAIASENRTNLFDDGACKFSRDTVDENFATRFKDCVAKHGAATLIIGDSHAMDLFNAMAQAAPSPIIVGVVKESCNPGPRRDARCPYRAITAFAKDNASSLKHIILTLSGDHFTRDSNGATLREENYAPVISFLNGLPPQIPAFWLGPQLEPGVDLRNINPLFPKPVQPIPAALEKMVNVDDLLSQATARESSIRYVSKIGLVQFDVDADFVIDGRYSYSDTHHWSVFGERLFGPRIVAGLKQLGLDGF